MSLGARDGARLAADRLAADRLADWYAVHAQDRALPWRRPGEPRWRAALAEGLLAQTTAAEVAGAYDAVFAGLAGPRDWLALPEEARRARVAPLGRPRLKEGAVTAIASGLAERPLSATVAQAVTGWGCGPYTAGMVALLHGEEAAPVDTNVERVGARVDRDGDAARWIAGLVGATDWIISGTGRAPGYEVVSAVLDIGATLCRPGIALCDRCPLASNTCAALAAGRVRVQLQLFRSGARGETLYHVRRVALRDWVLDLGWAPGAAPGADQLEFYVAEALAAARAQDLGNAELLAECVAASVGAHAPALCWVRAAGRDQGRPDGTAWRLPAPPTEMGT